MMVAEIGVMQLQAKEHQELPGATINQEEEVFFTTVFRESMALLQLDFWVLPSKPWENKFLLFKLTSVR